MIHFILIPEIYLPLTFSYFFLKLFAIYVSVHIALKMRILGIRHFIKSGPRDL